MLDAALLPAAVGADWLVGDLDDDVTPAALALAARGEPFALATIVAADGGPRPAGSQMVVWAGGFRGFLSGGCVEADVAAQARAAVEEGRPRRIAYGRGSPFFDIRLPCGGRIELLVEPVPPGDPTLSAIDAARTERRAVRYRSDGERRACVPPDAEAEKSWAVDLLHEPPQRLVVVGGDPFALAIAEAGRHQGWEVTLVRPNGPPGQPPLDVLYRRDRPTAALDALHPDTWTAVAVATHEADTDHEALLAALRSGAGYVGVLGSRRRLGERLGRLREAGVVPEDVARVRAPIGLPIAARSPRAIGLSVVGEVIDHRARRARGPG